jgi:hypothetical protein
MAAETNGQGRVEERIPFLIRIPVSKKQQFEDLYPWHGTLSQFLLQALDEFLEIQKGQATPSKLTQDAVANVVRKSY